MTDAERKEQMQDLQQQWNEIVAQLTARSPEAQFVRGQMMQLQKELTPKPTIAKKDATG